MENLVVVLCFILITILCHAVVLLCPKWVVCMLFSVACVNLFILAINTNK